MSFKNKIEFALFSLMSAGLIPLVYFSVTSFYKFTDSVCKKELELILSELDNDKLKSQTNII